MDSLGKGIYSGVEIGGNLKWFCSDFFTGKVKSEFLNDPNLRSVTARWSLEKIPIRYLASSDCSFGEILTNSDNLLC